MYKTIVLSILLSISFLLSMAVVAKDEACKILENEHDWPAKQAKIQLEQSLDKSTRTTICQRMLSANFLPRRSKIEDGTLSMVQDLLDYFAIHSVIFPRRSNGSKY